MDPKDAQERVRRLLESNRGWLQQNGVSSVVLDAFEGNRSATSDNINNAVDSASLGSPAPLPLACSSPAEQRRPLNFVSSRFDPSQTSTGIADYDSGRSGTYPGGAAASALISMDGVPPAVAKHRALVNRGLAPPPVLAWGNTAKDSDAKDETDSPLSPLAAGRKNAVAGGGPLLAAGEEAGRSPQALAHDGRSLDVVDSLNSPSDISPSGHVKFVDLPRAGDSEQPMPKRLAWEDTSSVSAGATHKDCESRQNSVAAEHDRADRGSRSIVDEKPAAEKVHVSKRGTRRQNQFRKRSVAPQPLSPASTTEHVLSSASLSPNDVVGHGFSTDPRTLTVTALSSPMATSSEDSVQVASTAASNDAHSVPRSLIARGSASTRSPDGAVPDDVRKGRLPPLTNLPAAPDSHKPVRPAAPPPYYLPAHQESRAIAMPALPCPLYGEFDLSSTSDSATFNAFSSKATASGKQAENGVKRQPKTADANIPPLHHCAWVGDMKRLKELLNSGHSPDVLDHYDRTALMHSCSAHGTNLMCADILVRNGANLNHQARDGSAALHEAAYVGSLSLIELLVANGASTMLRDNEGRLPMHYATFNKTAKCIAALLKVKQVNLDTSDRAGMTSLMWAAYFDRPAVCTYLLKLGADREEKDIDGRTAMHWAVHKSSITCLNLLLEHDMTYFKDHKGLTVLHIAAERGSVKATRFILSLREDSVNDLDRNGRSPLHWAAVSSRVDVCAILLEYGASPNLKDKGSLSPLDYAKMKKLTYVVALFTCFDWDSRPNLSSTASRFSLLSRWSSKVAPTPVDPNQGGGNVDNVSTSSISTTAEQSPRNVAGKCKLPEDYRKLLEDGTYMKVFTNNGKGPLQDKYFWVSLEQRHICWSKRRADRILGDYSSASAVSVEAGVQAAVTERADYRPDTTHRYSLTLTTSSFVMSVLAYTPQHFKAWTQGFGAVLHDGDGNEQRPLSPLWSGDAWGPVKRRANPTSSAQGLFQSVQSGASNQSTSRH